MAAQIRGGLKRSILNSLSRQVTGSVTLITILQAYQDALVAGTKYGKVIQATSQAGQSTSFRIPYPGEHFRPEDVAELSQDYLEVYADAVTTLEAAGNAAPTDAQITAQMLADDRLASITLVRKDYATLRFPNRF